MSVAAITSKQPVPPEFAVAAIAIAVPSTDIAMSSNNEVSPSVSAKGQFANLIAVAVDALTAPVIWDETSSSVTFVIPDTLVLDARSTFFIWIP